MEFEVFFENTLHNLLSILLYCLSYTLHADLSAYEHSVGDNIGLQVILSLVTSTPSNCESLTIDLNCTKRQGVPQLYGAVSKTPSCEVPQRVALHRQPEPEEVFVGVEFQKNDRNYILHHQEEYHESF